MDRTACTTTIAVVIAGLGLTAAAVAWADPKPDAAPPAAAVPDAEPLTPDGQIDFNRDIRPILSGTCFHCHGPDAATREAGLRLDMRDAAIAHRDFPAIVPGKPEESEIIALVTADENDRMPPKGKGSRLTDRQVELLKEWIRRGAEYAEHWAYVDPVRHEPPQVTDVDGKPWARNAIDRFVLARLVAEGLKPAPEADRYTLIRRLALDLTGLPPTIEEVNAFVNDTGADAYEKAVDRLLASPSFGEHWARKWLDLARYADSAGYADDPGRTIWGYRDWVIKAINENKPFDQFTVEQLAGDLLPDATLDQQVATAFHRNTQTNNEGGTDDEEFRVAAVVDRVNTTLAVWMGTTMACAQCHDHKYDPISQAEYFQFYAILNQTQDSDKRDERPTVEVESDEQKRRKADLKTQIAALERALTQRTPAIAESQQRWEQTFATPIDWQALRPTQTQTASGVGVEVRDDGTLFVPAAAQTDTHTLTFPAPAGKLSGLRIRTLPHESFPSKGAGHGGGNFVITRVLATVTPPNSVKLTGRYVRVELPGDQKMVSLAEVQVYSGADNVARRGKATQSSTDFNGPANLAIDGKTDGNYRAGSVTHTAVSKDPWWELDLGGEQAIDRVVLWNRTDGSLQHRLAGARVTLLDADRKPVWDTTIADPPQTSAEFAPGGARAVRFAAAYADYEQNGFPAAHALDSENPDKTGWAIGGRQPDEHTLTLVPEAPVDIPAGSTLTVTIEQRSQHANHTLGQYRVELSADESGRLAGYAAVPGEILAILNTPADRRDANQTAALANHYMTVAPELKPQRDELAKLKQQLENMKPMTTVPVFAELPNDKQRTTHIQLRGNFLTRGDEVTAGLPEVFSEPDTPKNPTRLDMARWLVDADNPLTARVAVNRYWEQLFGIGLVATSEEWGSQGELPSHPELLDWLALEFIRLGWDRKALLKTIVMSATYRQDSRVTPQQMERDPANRLLARGARFRLGAETIRDQALAAAGLLSAKMYGPPVNPPQPNLGLKSAFGGGIDWKTSDGEDRYRRGVYTSWRRTSPYPSMATFDAPNRQVCEIRRSRTNTPLQALVTLNDPVYVEAAQALGRRMAQHPGERADKVRLGFRLCLARHPSEAEVARLVELYEQTKSDYAADRPAAVKIATDPLGPMPEGADAVDLAAWTIVGNVLLNLDETLMNR